MLTMSVEAPLTGALMPRPSDHSQYDGGEEAERYDRRDDGQFGCEFHRKLSFPIGGVPVAQLAKFTGSPRPVPSRFLGAPHNCECAQVSEITPEPAPKFRGFCSFFRPNFPSPKRCERGIFGGLSPFGPGTACGKFASTELVFLLRDANLSNQSPPVASRPADLRSRISSKPSATRSGRTATSWKPCRS